MTQIMDDCGLIVDEYGFIILPQPETFRELRWCIGLYGVGSCDNLIPSEEYPQCEGCQIEEALNTNEDPTI